MSTINSCYVIQILSGLGLGGKVLASVSGLALDIELFGLSLCLSLVMSCLVNILVYRLLYIY